MQFRKLAAVAGTALIAGLSMAGPALAAGVTNVADIGSLAGSSAGAAVFPTFVVGKDAQPADVAAAINLAAYLAGNVYQTTSVAVTGGAATADGMTFRVELENTTANTKDFSLGSTDASIQPTTRGGRPATFLKEGSFTISGTEYKFYEKVMMVSSSLTTTAGYYMKRGSSDSTYENYYNNFGMAVPNDKLQYALVFDTPAPYGSNNLTSQTVKFLGSDYTVSSSSSTKVELAPVGGSVGLKAGESATVGDYTVTCDSVATSTGSSDASFHVCKGSVCSSSVGIKTTDGSKTVAVGTDSVQVSLTYVIYGGSAGFLVGSTSMKLENGQTLTNFPNWRAGVGLNAGMAGIQIANLTMTYVQPHTSFSGTYQVLQQGQSVQAPSSFFELKNLGYENRDYYRITMTTGSNSNFGGGSSSSQEGVIFKVTNPSTGASVKAFDAGGGTFSDQVAFDMTNGYWRYLNSSSGWSDTGNSIPTIQLTEKTMALASYNLTNSTALAGTIGVMVADSAFGAPVAALDRVFEIQEPAGTAYTVQKGFQLVADYNFSTQGYARFNASAGQLGGDTNPNFLVYQAVASNNSASMISLAYGGTTPKTRSAFTTNYGSKLVSADQTQVVVDVPKSENYIDVVLGREAGAASSGGTAVSKTPIQITSDVAKLDTEISDASKLTTDVVVMGGPAVNQLAATLLGKTYPTHGVDSGITENAALVKVFQNAFGSGHVAVLIAGWDAPETDLAVAAIQAGSVTNAVPAVSISGTVAAPTITAA